MKDKTSKNNPQSRTDDFFHFLKNKTKYDERTVLLSEMAKEGNQKAKWRWKGWRCRNWHHPSHNPLSNALIWIFSLQINIYTMYTTAHRKRKEGRIYRQGIKLHLYKNRFFPIVFSMFLKGPVSVTTEAVTVSGSKFILSSLNEEKVAKQQVPLDFFTNKTFVWGFVNIKWLISQGAGVRSFLRALNCWF